MYIFNDGNYYQGSFDNNLADTSKGVLECDLVKYEGEFKQGYATGLGTEKGPNYIFKGEYQKGIKT